MLLNEDDSEKNKKSGKETTSSKSGKESDNEWGEIEQNIFEEKKELKDNLLNFTATDLCDAGLMV